MEWDEWKVLWPKFAPRKMKTNTGASDSDEADHSSHRRRFREGGRGCRSGESKTCGSRIPKGITEQDIEWRYVSICSAKARVHIVWEAQSLWASQSRDLARLKAIGAYHFPDGPRRANSGEKLGSHNKAYQIGKKNWNMDKTRFQDKSKTTGGEEGIWETAQSN